MSTYEWAFLFGPGLVVGFGNGLILGWLMYRSGLVPRRMAMLGLVGGPMLIASFAMILFGAYENMSGPAFLLALPEIAWEISLGIYAAWKGFRPSRSPARLTCGGRRREWPWPEVGDSCPRATTPSGVALGLSEAV